MKCVACDTEVPDEDLFCENCGQALSSAGPEAAGPVPSGASCGCEVEEVDEEGFCLCCGRRVRRPPSDHMEERISSICAAVSDRGLHHDRNEDRFALVSHGNRYGLVLCDGVSSTSQSETASALVVREVSKAMAWALEREETLDAGEALRSAIRTASVELQQQTATLRNEHAPSTTVVAALVQGAEITVGWAGDSRAYWIDSAGARLLTRDHSWINEVVARGEISEEEARFSPQAHAITRWLGADAGLELEAEVTSAILPGPGWLLLCTDGLWNYVEEEGALAELLQEVGAEADDPLAVARNLVEHAKAQGGRDNISVALLRWDPAAPESAEEVEEDAEQSTEILRKGIREESHAESVQG